MEEELIEFNGWKSSSDTALWVVSIQVSRTHIACSFSVSLAHSTESDSNVMDEEFLSRRDVASDKDETDDNESSSKFFGCLSFVFVLEFDNGTSGVENKSSKSTDWSVWDRSGGEFVGISRLSIKGSGVSSLFDTDRDNDEDDDDDDDNISSGSCSCSDMDGVDMDDERSSRSGESKLKKQRNLFW